MCGLVGAASNYLSDPEINRFEDLMIVSNLRGRQGAGVIIANDQNKIKAVKVPGNGIDILDNSTYIEWKRSNNPRVRTLVGHTRLPTKGGTDISAVHPHSFEKLMGVHNGTFRKIKGDWVGDKKSDSYSFYKDVSERGLDEALSDASGAYALVWIDYDTGSLNFLRNSERTLWIAAMGGREKPSTIYWASEHDFLACVLHRKGFANLKGLEVFPLPVNQHWSIPLSFRKGFTIREDIRSDTKPATWSPPFVHRQTHHNTKNGKSGTNTVVHLNNPDKGKTFLVRDGKIVEKNDPNKQVFLPPASANDEHKGAEKNEVPVSKIGNGGVVSDEQRKKADAKVSDRKGGSTSVPQVPRPPVGLISKEESEFNDELGDLFNGPADSDVLFDRAYAKQTQRDEEELVETLRGVWLPLASLQKNMNHTGCEWCGDPFEYNDKLAWLDRERFLCENCQVDYDGLINVEPHFPFAEHICKWKDGRLKGVKPPPEKWFNHDGTYDSNDRRYLN